MPLLVQLVAAKWLLLAAVLALYFADKYRKYARLSAFNGPFSTGWSELWHTRALLGLRSHLAYKDVNDRYGACNYAVSLNRLLTCPPSKAQLLGLGPMS